MPGRLSLLAFVLLAACGPPCPDAAQLQLELDAAAPGDVVLLGACRVEGPLTIPAGVTLRGEGPTSVVTGDAGRVVTLATEAERATSLVDVRVESGGCAAVVATGDGEAIVERVEIAVAEGVGLGSEAATLTLRDAVIQGPIDEAALDTAAPALPPFACGGGAATHGLVVVGGRLGAERVDVSGFEAFGALLVDADTTWVGGAVRANLGVGLEVASGTADLRELTLARASFGGAAIEAYDGIFVDGAVVASRGLTVIDGSTYGLFHADGVDAMHIDATVRGNGFAGVWTQGGGALTLVGAEVVDNAFAGVASFDVGTVAIAESVIGETRPSVGVFGVRTVTAADGLHLIRSAGTVQATDLLDNGRVGMLLDLDGGSTAAYAIDDVIVGGEGAALGAIAQNGTAEAGWDVAIERRGDTAVNDALVVDPLDIAGAVGPPCLPPIDGVATSGLSSLVGP